jgi:hypothetical protein
VGAAKRQISLRNVRGLHIDGVEQKQAMNHGTPILQPTRGDDRRATTRLYSVGEWTSRCPRAERGINPSFYSQILVGKMKGAILNSARGHSSKWRRGFYYRDAIFSRLF